MDRIEKALNKLGNKERATVKALLIRIASGELDGLDVRKLKGREDVYRVRKGDFRIIFLRKSANIRILTLERRNSKTYRKR